MKKLIYTFILLLLTLTYSCKESTAEKLEEDMEEHYEKVEDHADNIEDAAEYVEDGVEDIEEAIENFKEALEEIEDPNERKIVRERILKIIDEIELKNQ